MTWVKDKQESFYFSDDTILGVSDHDEKVTVINNIFVSPKLNTPIHP